MTLENFINSEDYPLNKPESAQLNTVIEEARARLDKTGCAVLKDFIKPECVEELVKQSNSVSDKAFHKLEKVNVYNNDASTYSAEHPASIILEKGNGFVAWDYIPESHYIQDLYLSPDFQNFISRCFGVPDIYPMADPLAGLCVNILKPGREHPWHFDTNEFTVSMLTQKPAEGGDFEYCPNIRSPQNENLEDVKAVISGEDTDLVQKLDINIGDLQLFKGRYSLHRVSEVGGVDARHSAIFAYTREPGVIGTAVRTRQLFGRSLPIHEQAENKVRGKDALLD